MSKLLFLISVTIICLSSCANKKEKDYENMAVYTSKEYLKAIDDARLEYLQMGFKSGYLNGVVDYQKSTIDNTKFDLDAKVEQAKKNFMSLFPAMAIKK